MWLVILFLFMLTVPEFYPLWEVGTERMWGLKSFRICKTMNLRTAGLNSFVHTNVFLPLN